MNLRIFGYCSVPRSDNAATDAQITAELEQHAKQAGLQYERGLMCHSLFPPYSAVAWTDQKLSGPTKKRR
jgi:hypothetical protein